MGESTAHLALYKPAGSELVDVASHLNQNMDKIDSGVLGLDSRMGTVEGSLGISGDWETWTPTVTLGTTSVGVTVNRAQVLKNGTIVTVDVRFTFPSATYNTGWALDMTLPWEAVSAISGTGLLEKNPNVNPALAGPKVPYYYVSGPTAIGGTTDSAVAYPLVSTPPIEIDWDAPHDSELFTAVYQAFFSYRTNGIEV